MSGEPRDGGRDAVRDEALARLAHELRTPLAAIVGYAELVRIRPEEHVRLEAAHQIEAAAERLLRLVDGALAPPGEPG